MMIKALFFDIDGTLVSFKTHQIPASTVEALTRAREAGVEIYIATGRPYAIINNLDEIKHLITGYVTANGSYCFIGDEVVSCSPIPADEVKRIVAESDARKFCCVIVGERDIAMHNPTVQGIHIFRDMLNVDNIGLDTPLDKVLNQRVLQLTPIVDAEEEKQILAGSDDLESGRWYPAFTDLTARGVSKAKGLRAIARRQGFDISETMAFGDGGNDIPILREAGVGVAMGNASDTVKESADYVTTSVDDDGIMNALRHFAIIN